VQTLLKKLKDDPNMGKKERAQAEAEFREQGLDDVADIIQNVQIAKGDFDDQVEGGEDRKAETFEERFNRLEKERKKTPAEKQADKDKLAEMDDEERAKAEEQGSFDASLRAVAEGLSEMNSGKRGAWSDKKVSDVLGKVDEVVAAIKKSGKDEFAGTGAGGGGTASVVKDQNDKGGLFSFNTEDPTEEKKKEFVPQVDPDEERMIGEYSYRRDEASKDEIAKADALIAEDEAKAEAEANPPPATENAAEDAVDPAVAAQEAEEGLTDGSVTIPAEGDFGELTIPAENVRKDGLFDDLPEGVDPMQAVEGGGVTLPATEGFDALTIPEENLADVNENNEGAMSGEEFRKTFGEGQEGAERALRETSPIVQATEGEGAETSQVTEKITETNTLLKKILERKVQGKKDPLQVEVTADG